MTRLSFCPSEFTLERWRFGELAATPEEAPLIAHVEACPACRRRQAELAKAEAPPFDTETIWMRAMTGGAVQPSSLKARGGGRTFRWLGAAFAGTALATVLGVVLYRPAPDILTKGADWQLGVIARTGECSPRRLEPEAPVSPGDHLRFEVFTTWPKADIALLMLDNAGKVTPLAPADGRGLSISGGQRILLKEAVELDGSLGAERIVLVACNRASQALQVAEVVASARRALAAAHGDPRQVSGLGTGCREETFWITKVSR
jgi:hypothetical protein